MLFLLNFYFFKKKKEFIARNAVFVTFYIIKHWNGIEMWPQSIYKVSYAVVIKFSGNSNNQGSTCSFKMISIQEYMYSYIHRYVVILVNLCSPIQCDVGLYVRYTHAQQHHTLCACSEIYILCMLSNTKHIFMYTQ